MLTRNPFTRLNIHVNYVRRTEKIMQGNGMIPLGISSKNLHCRTPIVSSPADFTWVQTNCRLQCGSEFGLPERNMGKLTPSLAAETEALKEIYAALNRNDIPAMVKAFDPQIERIEPPDFPAGGTYRGHAAVQAHLSRARETWAEGSCEPEQFIVAGDKIIVFIYVRVRLKQEMEWRKGPVTDVFTFRNGKVIQMRTFADRQLALEWAEVKA